MTAGHYMPIWYDEDTAPADGESATWNATTKRWEPRQAAAAAVAAEAAIRAAADAAEASTRASADTTLTTNVATNAAAIAAETTRATTAEGLKLAKASNLSDVANAATALANLGGQATIPSGTYVGAASSAKQTVGNGGDPNGALTQDVKLLVTSARTSPTNTIEQHMVGYSFYTGTPGPGVGTLQGASFESRAYNNGSGTMATVLGCELIGVGDGDTTNQPTPTLTTVIGGQGSAWAGGVATIGTLIALRAAGPMTISGSPIVTEARSLDVQEPVTGTLRRAMKVRGAARFQRGTAANAIEISDGSDTKQWASDGTKWVGYASDGASVRVTLDPQDTPTTARVVTALTGAGKHISMSNSGSEVLSVDFAGNLTSARHLAADGSGAFPAHSFASSSQAGMFLVSANIVGIATGGTERIRFTAGGNIQPADGASIILGSSTGNRIGSATTQKMGFYGATPIVQPASTPAAASDPATTQALVNDIRTKLLALGLVA